jgi:hypothetical protein
MASRRKLNRHLINWVRYRNRCDKLVAGQQRPSQPGSPMRLTPGFFRAEGWNTDGGRWNSLRHGA